MTLLCLDGSTLAWRADTEPLVPPGTAVPVEVSVTPPRPGHRVCLDYRLDGGPIRRVNALPLEPSHSSAVRWFRAVVPPFPAGVVEFLPVLQAGDRCLSPAWQELPQPPGRYRVTAERSEDPIASVLPRWAWGGRFLGCLSARLRKEMVGATPEGLRINWHVVEGCFHGPALRATILPGATDWMRIRPDGVGIVAVTATLETATGGRLFTSYGGLFDLGADGYQRALRDEFDPLPPLVLTPTYQTADPNLAWLNRVQCLGVGSVDLASLELAVDVYQIERAGRITKPGLSMNPVREI